MAGVQPQPAANLIELEKSPNDKRIYKAYYADNGLRVLLISDPETDKAAACMTVNVGSLCDPRQLPGLAHFCEHMLFLGTERFPIENTYSKFISEHGGQCNAATKPDETLYAFDINPANLEEALDIFSQFFISPLFTESAALREINAIHAEYEKNLTNDTRRLFQLERSLSLPGHEYSRFFSGNRISLFQSPCARSLNTREQLLEFYDQWYSANLMALVVLGKQSIDELKHLVNEKFKGIKNNKVPEPHWTNTPWPEAVLKKKIYMEPLSDTHQLHLQWPIPDYSENYKSQPAAYVTHLLGHEGRGSLLSLFKRMGWVNRLSCGVSRPGKGFASLFLSLDLTDTGLGHVSDIITRVYQYINLMCSHEPQEWIFRENQSLNDLQFRFKDKEPPYDYVIELGTNMLHYKLEDALTGPYLLDSFEPVLVKDILSCLHPENSRVFEVSKTFAPQCTDTERWYGTRFLCMNISDEDLQTWRDCGVDPHMVLPEPNKYIATDFTIEPPPDGPIAETPELLYANDIFRLWHIQDEEFLLPKGFITIHLISPLAFQSPLRTLLTALYVELFVDHISEDAYNCMLAGMNVDFKRTTQGVKLSLSGYTHKLGLLTRNVIDHLIHFLAPTPDRFRYLREEIGREIKNFDLKSPYQQAGIFLTNVLCDRSWTNEELATAFPDITYDVLLNFIPQFFASLSEETLIYGNVTTKEALDCQRMIEGAFMTQFNSKPIPPTEVTMAREVIIPKQSKLIFQRLTLSQPTSAICYYLQTEEQSVHSDTMLNLFCEIINELAFYTLRTEQQLSYIVHTGPRRSNTLQGLRVILQSSERPDDLESHIESFLSSLHDTILFMSDEEFDKHVASLTTRLMEKPKGMTEQNSRFWCEIACHHYNFKRYVLEMKELDKITKSDVLEFYDIHISPPSATRKKLSVHVISSQKHGCNMRVLSPVVKGDIIKDPKKFKDSCVLSPVAEPFIPLEPKFPSERQSVQRRPSASFTEGPEEKEAITET